MPEYNQSDREGGGGGRKFKLGRRAIVLFIDWRNRSLVEREEEVEIGVVLSVGDTFSSDGFEGDLVLSKAFKPLIIGVREKFSISTLHSKERQKFTGTIVSPSSSLLAKFSL